MKSILIIAALIAAQTSQAAPSAALVMSHAGSIAIASVQSDDDEEEEAATPASKPVEPKKDEPKKDAPTAAPAKAAAPAPAAAAPVADAPTTAAKSEQMTLVSGAPLNNPNVGVHIVEEKEFSDARKFEVVLFPVAMQVNGKFTQHFGTMLALVYHLKENFAVQITGGYNWFNSESGFQGELVERAKVESEAASSLLWTWGVMGGVEVVPFYGKFAFFEGTLAHFSIVVNGAAGLGGTRHQLKQSTINAAGVVSPATFGDTGVRFMGSLGAGFRLQLGKYFAVRLEVRDVVYTARVERVNGCNAADLNTLDMASNMNRLEQAVVGGGCDKASFASMEDNAKANIPLAYNLVKNPTSDVLNNVGLYLGASFQF